MSYHLRHQRLSRETIDPHVVLSRTAFGETSIAKRRHMLWKHVDNPAGASMAHELLSGDGKLIGRLIYQRRLFRWNGHQLIGANLVDVLIHPDHRGIRTFAQLFSQFPQVESDLDFLYFIPNELSLPLYEKLLKLKPLLKMDVLAFPIDIFRLISEAKAPYWVQGLNWVQPLFRRGITLMTFIEHSRNFHFDDRWPDDGALDALLIRNRSRRCTGEKDAKTMRWRFASSPVDSYRVRFIYGREGTLEGFLATRIADYRGFKVCVFVDALVEKDKDAALNALALGEVGRAAKAECDIVLSMAKMARRRFWSSAIFPLVKVPDKHIPQQPFFFVIPLRTSLEDLPEAEEWELTLGDFDIF